MHNTEIRNNLIISNKNPVGFIKNGVATVDNIFTSDELNEWLEDERLLVKWQDGIFEKLALNRKFYETELVEPLKNIRIWQLKSDFDANCRFVSYEEMTKNLGHISLENYNVVFDGQMQTNDLEQIYSIFNTDHPQDYKGHSLSMSDMIELYDDDVSSFHYVDRFGFKEVEFTKHEQIQELNIDIKKGIQM